MLTLILGLLLIVAGVRAWNLASSNYRLERRLEAANGDIAVYRSYIRRSIRLEYDPELEGILEWYPCER